MPDFKEILKQKAQVFLNDRIEMPTDLSDLLNLSLNALKDISKEMVRKLEENMNIKTIGDLAQFNIEERKTELNQFGIKSEIFERWLLIAKILTKIVHVKMVRRKKIALVGLENAGKSAIRAAILQKYNMKEGMFSHVIENLKPTKGVEQETFSIFNNELNIWDMGGQKTYRKNYLEKPERFLLDISVIIFVIDVQDMDKYPLALNYLNNLVETFRFLNENPYFIIAFHKFDPTIQDSEDYNSRVWELWETISNLLEEKRFSGKKYITSIYDDFSLFHFFSEVLNQIIDDEIEKTINIILEEGAKENGLTNLIILTENGLKLGEYFKEKGEASVLYEQLYLLAMQAILSYRRVNQVLKPKKPIRSLYASFYSIDKLNFLMTRIFFLNRSLYIATLHPTKTFLEEKFVSTLLPWLSNLFI
ncbi:MAG: ADP-ribosylation factor-like protein [Candidatus Helarchaeota archaeon]